MEMQQSTSNQQFYFKIIFKQYAYGLLIDSVSLSSLHQMQNQDLTCSIPWIPLQRGVSTWLIGYGLRILRSYNFPMQTLVPSVSSFLLSA